VLFLIIFEFIKQKMTANNEFQFIWDQNQTPGEEPGVPLHQGRHQGKVPTFFSIKSF